MPDRLVAALGDQREDLSARARANMNRIEAWLIRRALEQHGQRRTDTAKKLGITREGLYK